MSYQNYRKKTPKVNSTVMFKFTEQEHTKINGPFRHSFQLLKEGKGNQTDWFNVTFRIKCAYLISLEWYEDLTVHELKNVLEKCEAIEKRSEATQHTVWQATPEELDYIEAGLDAVEEMQRTIQRKFFYSTCVKADCELREKYVACNRWKQNIKKPS